MHFFHLAFSLGPTWIFPDVSNVNRREAIVSQCYRHIFLESVFDPNVPLFASVLHLSTSKVAGIFQGFSGF